jgi:hypothetical protein
VRQTLTPSPISQLAYIVERSCALFDGRLR